MKVGDLVEQAPSVHQLGHEPYHGKLGIVVEVDLPDRLDDPDLGATCWVRWQGNVDWDMEAEKDLNVVSS